jgi:uncharacterized protein YaeQ
VTATIYKFDIDLADADRQVYDTLAFQAAQHPSESEAYLVTRVLAFALEFTDGIAFSAGGISDPEEPAIAVRDLTGALRVWIDIGAPDAERLHKAAKSAPRVAVYTHRDPAQLVARYEGARIHRPDAIELYAFDRSFINAVALRLERRMSFALSVAERELFLTLGTDTLSGTISRYQVR